MRPTRSGPEHRGNRGASDVGADNYIFLAGSAINGMKNAGDQYDPALGVEAMQQAIGVFRENVFAEAGPSHPTELRFIREERMLWSEE